MGLLYKSMFKTFLKHVDCFKMLALNIKQTTIKKIRDFLVSTIYVFFQYQYSHAFHTFIRKYGIFLEDIHSLLEWHSMFLNHLWTHQLNCWHFFFEITCILRESLSRFGKQLLVNNALALFTSFERCLCIYLLTCMNTTM